jgi:hypothetical protein
MCFFVAESIRRLLSSSLSLSDCGVVGLVAFLPLLEGGVVTGGEIGVVVGGVGEEVSAGFLLGGIQKSKVVLCSWN